MKCELCGALLDAETLCCPACGAKYAWLCPDCGEPLPGGEERCPRCGERALPGLEMTRQELQEAGLKCFMPYAGDRVYQIYYGGHNDGEGYVFRDRRGYTHEPPQRRVVLASLVEGHPIYGVWNTFFCAGDELMPEQQEATYERMMAIREIVLSNGIQDVMTFAFFGCAGLELLELPRSLKNMKNDFYDLFKNGQDVMGNGVRKTPITVRYRGTEEDWRKVAVSSRFWDYVDLGCIRMEYLGR